MIIKTMELDETRKMRTQSKETMRSTSQTMIQIFQVICLVNSTVKLGTKHPDT